MLRREVKVKYWICCCSIALLVLATPLAGGRLNTLDQWWLPEGVSCYNAVNKTSVPPPPPPPHRAGVTSPLSPPPPALESGRASHREQWSIFFGLEVHPRKLSPGVYKRPVSSSDSCRFCSALSPVCHHGGRGLLSPGWEQAGDDYRWEREGFLSQPFGGCTSHYVHVSNGTIVGYSSMKCSYQVGTVVLPAPFLRELPAL